MLPRHSSPDHNSGKDAQSLSVRQRPRVTPAWTGGVIGSSGSCPGATLGCGRPMTCQNLRRPSFAARNHDDGSPPARERWSGRATGADALPRPPPLGQGLCPTKIQSAPLGNAAWNPAVVRQRMTDNLMRWSCLQEYGPVIPGSLTGERMPGSIVSGCSLWQTFAEPRYYDASPAKCK